MIIASYRELVWKRLMDYLRDHAAQGMNMSLFYSKGVS